MSARPRHASTEIVVAGLLFALLVLGLSTAPPAAAAAGGAVAPLSPELTKLATSGIGDLPAPAQAKAIGVPAEGPGSLVHEGDRVVVEAHFEEGAMAGLEALQSAGARIMVASRRYQTVALSIDPEDLGALAEVPGLSTVVASRQPSLYGADATSTAAAANGACEGGSVISQGLDQLNVPAARAAFGARGAGETIGVISDSFDSATTAVGGGAIATHAHEDEASNDLPGPASLCGGGQVPVRVLAEGPANEATDEGRAMLQVIHDLAPHAELAFATAYASELEFARNIERLAEPVAAGGAGADVIVDDIGYFAEPFYQDGTVADAIRKVTAEGVVYLTAAGNDNLIESGTGKEIGSWERSEFRDATCPSAVVPYVGEASSSCMNFSPSGTDSTFGITVAAGSTLIVDLQWAEPWYGVKSDLDAYLLNAAGTSILAARQTNNGEGSGAIPQPVEILSWTNTGSVSTTVQLAVNRCILNCNPAASFAAKPRLKFVLLEDGAGVSKTEYPSSNAAAGITVGPTIYGHAGSAAAITLAAVNFEESPTAPVQPEPYSSRGPVTHYFDPVSGTAPAAKLAVPELLEKPNLTATDCASTTFFANLWADGWHFCGTSEAAPHAAAVAALMRQTDPHASPDDILTAMEGSATAFTGVSARTAVGAGLLNAGAALAALGGAPVDDPADQSPGSSEEEAAGALPTEREATPTIGAQAGEPLPVVTITSGPGSLGDENRPTFEFTVTGAASLVCQLDGRAPEACASPYTPATALADGAHSFLVTATNAQGRGASATYAFRVDTVAPRTRVVGHPNALLTTHGRWALGRFRLRASELGATFYCRLDRGVEQICPSRFRRRFGLGRHVLRARSEDAAGNIAPRPTVFRFRVKRSAGSPGRR
jgi:hypothetical protein